MAQPRTDSMIDVTDTELAHLAQFQAGYRLGAETMYPIAYAHGVADESAAWTSVFTGCSDTWRNPRQAVLTAARNEVQTQPCAKRCRRCSRCARSISYWSRGGRDFLGVEAEAALVAERVLAGAGAR